MPATEFRKAGEFCWFNMLTPDPAAARAFFTRLLGGDFVSIGIGHTVRVGGDDVGALFDLAAPGTPPGTPPLIGVMVKVESADAAAGRVTALGGRARPAFDVGPAGRMSVCHDPAGAEFDVWEPRSLQGTSADPRAPGAPAWFETMTPDLDRASSFYSALFGWESSGADTSQRAFSWRGRELCGATRNSDGPARWATYFAVRDAEKTGNLAVELGAGIVAPLTTFRGSRALGIRSPQGVPFHIMER